MTFGEFDKFLDDFVVELKKLGHSKGREYSGTADRLANFKRQAERKGVSPETVCSIFGDKHRDCIDTFVRFIETEGSIPGETSEPIEGRFHDVVNYYILLAALVYERKQAEKKIT